MKRSLQGKVIVVSGGTKGIGKGVILESARQGANVASGGRDRAAAEEILKEVRAAGQEGIFVHTDLHNAADCAHLMADWAFDTAGVKATITNGFRCLKRDGTLIQIGNLSPFVEAPLQTLVNSEIKWIGRYGTFTEYEGALSLLSSGRVSLDDCLSKVAPLQDGQEWFDRLHALEPGLLKVVLVP